MAQHENSIPQDGSTRRQFLAVAGAVAAGAAMTGHTPAHALTPAQPEDRTGRRRNGLKLYVAPDGDDMTGDGSHAHPWATIQRARDAIREGGLNQDMSSDIVANVAAGTYRVVEPIVFGHGDSGTNGHQIIYRSQDGPGKARLLGAAPVQGWERHKGGVFRAFVGTERVFHTLYENGVRATPARYPKCVSQTSRDRYLVTEGVPNSHTQIQYEPDDLDPTGWDLSQAQVVIWSGPYDWFTDTVPIREIDSVERRISLAQATRYAHASAPGPAHLGEWRARYFIQNVPQLLDTPGEFHLDQDAGYLYYWPRRGGAITDNQVFAPTVKTILTVQGSSEILRVENITFDGLGFEYSDFTDWYRFAWINAGDSGENHQYPGYDRTIEMPQHRTGMVRLENSRNIQILNSHLKNSGYSAIALWFVNEGTVVAGSRIEHSGYNGVQIVGRYPGEGDVARENAIHNNYISHVGELVGHGAGVELTNSGYNVISHNRIHDSPRYAVTWRGYWNVPNNANYAAGNVFKYLDIHDVMQDSGDGSAANSSGLGGAGATSGHVNTIEQVLIDSVRANSSVLDLPANGIFLDLQSTGQVLRDVQVTNTQAHAFHPYPFEQHALDNVSWSGGFDPSRMEYASIGVGQTFPYPVPAPHVAAPQDITVQESDGDLLVRWLPSARAATYRVGRSNSAGGPYVTVAEGLTTTEFRDHHRNRQYQAYYYVVTAVAAEGTSSLQSREAVMPDRLTPAEVIVDDDHGVPRYVEEGTPWTWSLYAAEGIAGRYSTQSGSSATWTPVLPRDGSYEVDVRFQSYPANTPTATYRVRHATGEADVVLSQVGEESRAHEWRRLGTWDFLAGDQGWVRLAVQGATGLHRAEAVRFVELTRRS